MAKKGRPIKAAYKEAKAGGQGKKFLKNHPQFAEKRGVTPKQRKERPLLKPNARLPKKIRNMLSREARVEDYEAQKEIGYMNPDYNTALGSSQTTVDENGNVTVNQTLSPEQQKILDQGQQLTQLGQGFAQQMMQGYTPFGGYNPGGGFGSGGISGGGPPGRPSGTDGPPGSRSEGFRYGYGGSDPNATVYTQQGGGAPPPGGQMSPLQPDSYGGGAQLSSQYSQPPGPFGPSDTMRPMGGPASGPGGYSPFQAGGQRAAGNAQGLLSMYNPFSMSGNPAERNRIEQAMFERLNRDTEMNRGRDLDVKQQELFNKGIPYSDDPNSRYQKEIGDINRRYDDISAQNRGQAVEMGGAEHQRAFGMGLSQHQQGISDIGSMFGLGQAEHQQGMGDRSQLFGEQLTTQQQRMNEMLAMQGMGTGLMMPNLPGYTGPGYDMNNPTEVQLALKQLQLQQQQLNPGGGGGGGGSSGGGAAPPPGPPDFPVY